MIFSDKKRATSVRQRVEKNGPFVACDRGVRQSATKQANALICNEVFLRQSATEQRGFSTPFLFVASHSFPMEDKVRQEAKS